MKRPIQPGAAAFTHPLSSIFSVSLLRSGANMGYEGVDGQVPRQRTEVLMYSACVCVCACVRVCGWRLGDDCLAAACSFNPALSLPPSPALN